MPSATVTTAVPTFVSPEEHKNLVGSTPASFNDIPSVLRHQEENVSVTLDPPLDGFSSEDGARGTLYVIESVLVFMSTTGRGFQIEYPAITLHAISRAESGPSIYCQLDESASAAADDAPSDDVSDMRELSIVPQNVSALEPIFEALSLCASLHPDAIDDMDDDDDAFIDAEGQGFELFTGADGEELSEVGRAALEHLESIIHDPHTHEHEDDVEAINGGGVSEESDADGGGQ